VLLKRRAYALACFSLLSVFVALSSVLLQSQARYAMVVFPTFMVLATWGRNSRVDTLIRTVSLVLLSLMTALFAAHFSLALS
jgi:cytochrome b561